MMRLEYVNSKGETLDLTSYPYNLQDEPLYDFAWSSDLTSSGTKKSIVNRFLRTSKELQMDLVIHADTQAQFQTLLDHFFRVTEYDVINKTPGRLVLKDSGEYISCYVVSSGNTMWQSGIRTNVKKISFLFTYPFWITEETKSFYKTEREEGEETFLDYPYPYPYDYLPETGGIIRWSVDHYTSSEFLMTIFGYVENPKVVVNDYEYQIMTTLESNEYLQIDSRNNTVEKFLANGVVLNVFDLRNKANSIFEPIPSGNLMVTWNGSFGFDITLFLERSEPVWL